MRIPPPFPTRSVMLDMVNGKEGQSGEETKIIIKPFSPPFLLFSSSLSLLSLFSVLRPQRPHRRILGRRLATAWGLIGGRTRWRRGSWWAFSGWRWRWRGGGRRSARGYRLLGLSLLVRGLVVSWGGWGKERGETFVVGGGEFLVDRVEEAVLVMLAG